MNYRYDNTAGMPSLEQKKSTSEFFDNSIMRRKCKLKSEIQISKFSDVYKTLIKNKNTVYLHSIKKHFLNNVCTQLYATDDRITNSFHFI